MENFMLLEEEDYEENRAKLNQPEKKKNNDDSNDQHRSKYSDDDEEDKSSHKANNVYEKHSRHNPSERSPKQDGQVDTSPTTKRKKRNKQKHIHRDQGGYGSSSDAKSDNPDHEPMLKNHSKSRENLASSAPSSREELGGGAKAKRRHSPSLNYFPQDEELSSQEFQGPKKDTFRHFADDEDEEMYKQLKNQKQKSAQHELHKNHSAGQFNRNNNNGEPSFIKVKPQFVSASVFSEDKIFADKVAVFQQNYQESKERVASQHDSRKQSSPEKQSEVVDIAQNDKGHRQIDQAGAIQEQEIVLALQQTANQQIQENQQQHNHHHQRQTKDEQSRGINAQETHSLDDQASRKTKKNEKRNKDENASSGSEAGTPDHRARSDDNASSQYHNSPDYLKNNDVHSIRPDFLLSKPFVLNYNTHHQTQLTSNDTYSTLHKLGIQKDMFQLDKSESQKSNGSYALGPQTSASLSGDNNTTVGNTKTMQSSANHNNNNNPSNQLINGQHNLIDSSSTSSEESSDEQSKPTAQTKRSKGDGGVSISSDSDQNNKQKQRQTPQQKYKKDPSAKESREPSKERANNNNNNGNANNTPQLKVKKKKAKDVIEVEKVKSRRDDREQQLEQLLRDMGINKKLIIDYTELEFGKKIGEGSYGQVFKGEWQRTDVAIKQFGKKNSKFHLRKVQDFISEVRVMNNLRHPNIVLYMGVCLYQSQYFMITEYLKEGSLFDHLHKLKTNFSETNLITMIEDMALGMVYLHGRKVMHCDLKSSNVLIDENWNVKLCDFGLSRIKSTLNKKKDERKAEGLVGTPQWMAPEIMRREQYQEHSDVYSFGMIMWELITKKIPYKGLSHQQIYGTVGYDNNYQVEIPKRGIPRYLNLMRKCLIREPSKRPTFQEIVDEVQLMKTDLKDNNKKQVVKEIIRFFD